jgi:hypothetical protein
MSRPSGCAGYEPLPGLLINSPPAHSFGPVSRYSLRVAAHCHRSRLASATLRRCGTCPRTLSQVRRRRWRTGTDPGGPACTPCATEQVLASEQAQDNVPNPLWHRGDARRGHWVRVSCARHHDVPRPERTDRRRAERRAAHRHRRRSNERLHRAAYTPRKSHNGKAASMRAGGDRHFAGPHAADRRGSSAAEISCASAGSIATARKRSSAVDDPTSRHV